MSTLQKLQCDNCGGHIDRATLTCKSCGLEYRYEHETQELRIITETRKMDILHGAFFIPDEYLHEGNAEEIISHSIKRLASRMAEQLIPYMEWERESDPAIRETKIYSRVLLSRPTSGGETR